MTDDVAIEFLPFFNLNILQWVPNYDQPSEETNKPGEKIHENLKRLLPKLTSMAKKEGLIEDKMDADKPGEAIKVDTILSVFKDEKVKIKV